MFDAVLIANRGEIALRVARACRELHIRTIAAYSTDDYESAVVDYADEAICIGPAAPRRSYLNISAVVEAARRTRASAIHPGYGFLSENRDLAEVCHKAGIVFVGPPPGVLAQLGDKIAARKLMAEHGVPTLPGSADPVESAAEAQRIADQIGFPVMVKAAAGGGGKGMRVVRERSDLVAAYRWTRSRARELFGDHRVFVERFLEDGRHIEIQVLVDSFGGAVHVGDRDCSTQRRHQKLIEEGPAPGLSPEVVSRLGRAAVSCAVAAGYVGAGTFEFLLGPDGSISFLEVNCRIQVEHPVTEMIFGVDLVREQLRIAAGERLGLAQADLVARGTAIECRINAEDPQRDFAPAAGTLDEFRMPGGPFVRVDTHAFPGYRVPPAYDSLLAKLIVWGRTRDEAIDRMERALSDFRISGTGVRTTAAFLQEVVRGDRFRSGRYNTSIIDELIRERQRFGRPVAAGSDFSC